MIDDRLQYKRVYTKGLPPILIARREGREEVSRYLSKKALIRWFGPGVGVCLGVVRGVGAAGGRVSDHVHLPFFFQYHMTGIQGTWGMGRNECESMSQ